MMERARDDSGDNFDEQEEAEDALVASARQSYFAENLLQDCFVQFLATDSLARSSTSDTLDGIADLAALNAPERLEVDKESAHFLASVVALTADTEFDPAALRLRPSFHDLRLEEPALSTDPQMDMIGLAQRNEVEINTEGMKPFPLDVERDQSFEWPKKSYELLDRKIATEKLDVDYETVEYLKEIHGGPKFDTQEWFDKGRTRSAWKRLISPPLLPLSPPFSPDRLSPSAAQVELTSTPDDPMIREAAELEDELLGRDDAVMEEDAQQLINKTKSCWHAMNSSSSSPVATLSSPVKRKAKDLQNLKGSSPVLLGEQTELSAKRAKTILSEDEISALIPHTSEDSMDLHVAADKAMATVVEIIAPLAAPAIERASNEQLNKFDTILRVPVPPIDSIKPTYCCEPHQEDAQTANSESRLLQSTRDEIMKVEKKWTGVSSLERDLPWAPFPSHYGKIKPEDDFDDGSCSRYLAELDFDGEVDLEALLCEMDGLRVLDPDEHDEDELAPAEYDSNEHNSTDDDDQEPRTIAFQSTPPVNIPTSAAKPQSNFTDSHSLQSTITVDTRSSLEALLAKRRLALEQRGKALDLKASQRMTVLHNDSTISNEAASSSSPLQEPPNRSGLFNFAKLQGWSDFTSQPSIGSKSHPDPASTPSKPETITKSNTTPPPVPIPQPQLHNPNRPLSIILSAKTMTNRPLIRKLTSLLPNVTIIERDYGSASTSPVTTNPSHPTLLDLEADITLSPTTGILLTNLQKLKQRPLPGHEASSPPPFTSLIQAISRRYDRLIILITDGRDTAHPTLDATDTSTLNALTDHATALTTAIDIIFVPGRATDHLPQWVAAAILRHAPSSPPHAAPDIYLLQHESLWERFLRKAGMNAFAAQVLLQQVKTLPRAEGGSAAAPGLAAFVVMSPEERARRFAGILGGEGGGGGMLRRVDRALEARWLSASND